MTREGGHAGASMLWQGGQEPIMNPCISIPSACSPVNLRSLTNPFSMYSQHCSTRPRRHSDTGLGVVN